MWSLQLILAVAVPGMGVTDVSGTWTGTLEHKGDLQGICIYLAQEGKQVKGQIAYRHDTKVAPVDGLLEGDAVDLVIADGLGSQVNLKSTGLGFVLAGIVTIDGKSDLVTLTKYESSSRYYRFGKAREEPFPLRASQPAYTQRARESRLQGTVSLGVSIESSGAVGQNVTVIRGLGLGLDEEAIKSAKKWVFSPPDNRCNPKPTNRRIDVQFVLPE